jgi:hypothetical protein
LLYVCIFQDGVINVPQGIHYRRNCFDWSYRIMKEKKSRIKAGILAIVFFFIHAGVIVQTGEPYHILRP